MSKSKEVRGNRLLKTIRTFLPQIGNVKLEGERRVTCHYRSFPFVITSRMVVKEQGLGSKKFTSAVVTEDSEFLQNRLRQGLES